MEKIKNYFNCGNIHYESKTIIKYRITKTQDFITKLLPFMDQHQLHTIKKNHYEIFKKVCLLKTKKPFNKQEFLEIVDLAYNMNKGGVNRKLTREEY